MWSRSCVSSRGAALKPWSAAGGTRGELGLAAGVHHTSTGTWSGHAPRMCAQVPRPKCQIPMSRMVVRARKTVPSGSRHVIYRELSTA